jgi:FkbM family methyltransferase
MQQRLKRIAKSVVFRVRRDAATGHLYYPVAGKRLYIRMADECMRPSVRHWVENELYFKHYRPSGNDVVVDFGAGLGEEILGLARTAPDIRYIAVEIQPWVYECLCLTLVQLPAGYVPCGLAVGSESVVRIAPTLVGLDASITEEGPVPVEGITWPEFTARYGIDRVDLLKMNIEGAEADLLDHIDLAQVKRIIVSAHDFMADRGHGERYRTRARVEERLLGAGFHLTPFEGSYDWMRSWIYAHRDAASI